MATSKWLNEWLSDGYSERWREEFLWRRMNPQAAIKILKNAKLAPLFIALFNSCTATGKQQCP